MTDETQSGQGKALASGVTSFCAVLAAVFLREHYNDLFNQVQAAGYPLTLIIATIAGVISHVTTFWTSTSIVSIIIGWIGNIKKIQKAWQSKD